MDFERAGRQSGDDETAVNLRAYFDRIPEEKLREYDPAWNDEKVIEWDDNFKDDGNLFLPCSERGVDIQEYRRVLHLRLAWDGTAQSSARTHP
jgi:hypothetical protein